MKYQFKAKDLKTGEWIIGDLGYVQSLKTLKTKPIIMTHYCHGGMIWVGKRYYVDENTIELTTQD